ncbi:regulator of chromosome condensation 1/beta-lactamase-inhibitor protein II [Podospora fimiseda]|uniref:Regulator of chromosome condensation 1/beta-lactamase-inhibitor protein II n=1 Tax=Podospora fimiseda TaxID=252190 RepID=A0AAN7GU72_9PEZI|nr:regulator of chromosome condensation 1/beta-lactamase-inhibitor protein II [Podospora fimiseda]
MSENRGVNDLGALGRDTTWDGGMVNMDGDGGEENSDAEESDDGLNPKESRPGLVDFSGMGVEPGMIKQVVAGDSATWIVTYDGDVYGWGSMRSNEGKELFSPQVRIQKLPTKIPLPEKISKLASGSNHVVALTFSGTIYTWGFAYEQGQLGRKVMERNKKQLFSAFTPRKLALRKIKDIFSGADHSFALAEDGKTVYGWGLNNFGQTGVITNRNAGEDSATVMIPTKFKLGEEEKVEMIAASNKHSLALTKEGKCLGWGQLDGYALGFKLDELPEEWEEVVVRFREKPRILKKPTIIPGLPKLRCIAAGGSHSVAVAEEDGRVWTWGYNISHQLGHRRDEEVETPRVVEGKAVLDKRFVWADAGGQFTVLAEEE